MADLNPLLSDRDVEFQLFEVGDARALCQLPAFAEHSAASIAQAARGALQRG